MNLIDRMQAHRDSGGAVFDCPSFSASPEEKIALQKAIKAMFDEQFKGFKPWPAQNTEQKSQ